MPDASGFNKGETYRLLQREKNTYLLVKKKIAYSKNCLLSPQKIGQSKKQFFNVKEHAVKQATKLKKEKRAFATPSNYYRGINKKNVLCCWILWEMVLVVCVQVKKNYVGIRNKFENWIFCFCSSAIKMVHACWCCWTARVCAPTINM